MGEGSALQKLSGRLVPLVLLVFSSALTCQRTPRATESVPPWVALLIAKWSLEPADPQPYEVWRYQYRGADAYYIPPRCCDFPAAIYDANGTFLGTGAGGLSGRGQLSDFPRTGGTLLWQSDPSTQGPAAAQAVLRDPRFAREPALLAFARLEVDTGVAWEGGLAWGPGPWPTSLRASAAPIGTASAGRTLEQAAMDFLDAAAAAAAAGTEVHRRKPTLKIAGVQPRSLVIDVCGQAQPHLRYDGFVRLDVGDAGVQQELYFVDGRSGAVTLYPPSPLARE